MVHFWLRVEDKPMERRVPITPEQVKVLLDKGHTLTVEDSATRAFATAEYAAAGAQVAPAHAWHTEAPADAIILGLKELPEEDSFPLTHTHIMFGHCYKGQAEAKALMQRFASGGGTLLDLEVVVHPDTGRRVAAFGVSAGFVGACSGALAWAQQYTSADAAAARAGASPDALPQLEYADSFEQLAAQCKEAVDKVCNREGGPARPRVHVVGALGRCGTGARNACKLMGLETIDWDMAETAPGGPFPALLDSEILVNAILLDATNPPPAFLTTEMLNDAAGKRKLRVVVDVSCDASNPTNPVPIYSTCTTFLKPALRLRGPPVSDESVPLDVIAVDHLPTLVASEASTEFATALLPYLADLDAPDASELNQRVWKQVREVFATKKVEVLG